MELALDGPDVDDLLVVWIKFQSLFSWNLLLMAGMLNGITRGSDVSILVFVELALDVLRYPLL